MESATLFGTREYLKANKLGLWAIQSRIGVLELQQQNARAIRKIYLDASKRVAREIAELGEGLHKAALVSMKKSLDVQSAVVGMSLQERMKLDITKAANYGVEGIQMPFSFVLDEAGATSAGVITAAGLRRVFVAVNELAVAAQYARTINGLTLSERVWSTAAGFRSELNNLIQASVAEGLGAKKTAKLIEELAQGGGYQLKKTILADYPKAWKRFGQYGWSKSTNWEALRLARTEINFAFTEATVIAGQMTPGYIGSQWNLSSSHPEVDICDDYAERDEDGLGAGVYRSGNEPLFAHPNCLCFLTPVFEDREKWIKGINSWVKGGSNPTMDKWYREVYQGMR